MDCTNVIPLRVHTLNYVSRRGNWTNTYFLLVLPKAALIAVAGADLRRALSKVLNF